jgi:hypothetical protein
MPGIFISYRKEDTRPWAISLRDHLAAQFGEQQIFFDVDSLEAGHWRAQIDRALDACRIVLVLIGPRWTAATDADGRKRLFLPDDVHRAEVASALSRPHVTVIPVLLDGAKIPRASELPDDLRALLERQISEIGDAYDRRVVELRRLTRTIDGLTGRRRLRARAAAAVTATVAVGAVNTTLTANSPSVAVVFLLVAAFLALFSLHIYRRMAREHLKGAGLALLALILSAALIVGSAIRLVVRLAQPAEVSWNQEA